MPKFREMLPYIGPVIGLTGFITALYFHAQSIQERVPTYYVSPQRAVIVDARGPAASSLQVLYYGKPVKTSVTAVIVYFWNDGKLPIRNGDILGGPLSIDLDEGAEILEAKLLKVSRPVIKFATGVGESAKNSLPVGFDILERNDGAAIQIVYSGSPDAGITMRGTVVGAAGPRLLGRPTGGFRRLPDSKRERRFDNVLAYTLGYLGVISGFGIAYMALILRRRFMLAEPRLTLIGSAVMPFVIVSVFLVAVSSFLLFLAHREASPGVPAAIWSET